MKWVRKWVSDFFKSSAATTMLRSAATDAAREEERTHEGGRRAKRRCTSTKKSYVAPGARDIYLPSSRGEDRWQKWPKEQLLAAERIATSATTKETTAGERSTAAQRKRQREKRVATEEAAAAATPTAERQTAQQRLDAARRFIVEHRNANTSATYESAWKQFVRWVEGTENPRRAAADAINSERPSAEAVALYAQYLVQACTRGKSSCTGTGSRTRCVYISDRRSRKGWQ